MKTAFRKEKRPYFLGIRSPDRNCIAYIHCTVQFWQIPPGTFFAGIVMPVTPATCMSGRHRHLSRQIGLKKHRKVHAHITCTTTTTDLAPKSSRVEYYLTNEVRIITNKCIEISHAAFEDFKPACMCHALVHITYLYKNRAA